MTDQPHSLAYFMAEPWSQPVYADLLEEVEPYDSSERFRKRTVGYTGDQSFWATPSPEPLLSDELIARLSLPLDSEHPIRRAAVQLASRIAERFDPREVLFVSILRAGVPVANWLTQLLPGSQAVATSLFIGHGIDQVSLQRIRLDHPERKIIFVDGWTGKGGVTGELRKLGAGPLAVLSDPWGVAYFRGTSDDILSPSACFTGPMTLGFSRTFTRQVDECFAAYRFPNRHLNSAITNAWIGSCPAEVRLGEKVEPLDALGNSPVTKHSHSLMMRETSLRVHSNEVCRALINSNPVEVLFAGSIANAQEKYELLLELADSQDIPQRFHVDKLQQLKTKVACSLKLARS